MWGYLLSREGDGLFVVRRGYWGAGDGRRRLRAAWRVPELRRSIWALDKVGVYDGRQDSDADTLEDNAVFATQGVFAP